MQSAAVPSSSTSNGIKRSAAASSAALLSSSTDHSSSTASAVSMADNHGGGGGGGGGDGGRHGTTSSSASSAASSSSRGDHDQSISPPPPEKRSFIVIESPLKLGTIAGAEDLDIRVLRIQNKNLSERLLQRQKLEAELRDKIDSLLNRKAADDSKICIFDRYWTQLDEDLRLMLERFDSACAASAEELKSGETTTAAAGASGKAVRNFLSKLNDWDKVEIDDKLKERVKFTTQTVSKLVTNYDRIMKRIESFHKELSQEKMETDSSSSSDDSSTRHRVNELYEENCKLNQLVTQCQQKAHLHGIEFKQLEDKIVLLENEIKELNNKNDETEYELEKTRDKAFRLDRQLADTMIKLSNLQKAANLASSTNSNNNNNNNNHNSANSNNNNSHADQNGHGKSSNASDSSQRPVVNLTDKQLTDMETELEEQRELAASRLQELEKLNLEYQSSLKHIEKLKSDLKTIPESVVEQTNEFKNLQTKYSLIVSDNMKLKQVLDETRVLMETSRAQFQRQLEQMEADDREHQKRLCAEMLQLEEQLTQVRKENELLRIEYEQNVAANEQTGPINKEMRSLITTLQTNNKLLKSDNVRCKKRLDEVQQELQTLKKQSAQMQAQLASGKKEAASSDDKSVKSEAASSSSGDSAAAAAPSKSSSLVESLQKRDEQLIQKDSEIRDLKEQIKRLQENQKDYKNLLDIYKSTSLTATTATATATTTSTAGASTTNNGGGGSQSSKAPGSPNVNSSSSGGGGKMKNVDLEEAKLEIKRLNSIIEKLKTTSSSSSSVKSIPIVSPSTSSSSTTHQHQHHHHHHDDGDKPATASSTSSSAGGGKEHAVSSSSAAQVAVSNHSSSSSSSSTAALNDYAKKFKAQEEKIIELHKMLSNKKQEEAALLNDMEITGQAYEDMQEQNIRLMQQLREKDDANFKLVSERIKLENVQKILKEEKEIYAQQIATLQEQHENTMNMSKKFEEQIFYYAQTVAIYEKEIGQLQQSCEIYKRQAVDNVQLIQDLRLNTHKYLCQLKEAQQHVAEKTEALAAQAFSSKRAQEEIKQLQSRLERQKKFEMAANMDEVLKEEIKEYKEQLRCPSCKVKDKDAVLTKCFHVFCFDCLQKRYDTRQRKCPKCNANFGANDFRKLYLS